MRAWVLRENFGPGGLSLEQIPSPRPGRAEILIQVKASALNRADLLQTHGHYPAPKSDIEVPGLEFAGEVLEVGAEVRGFAVAK
ncbi:MAG: alcohol dehydrogenase catalytic domain-containing protein [Planctomycetota bacterium]